MQYSTGVSWLTRVGVRLHLLVVGSLLGLAVLGRVPDSNAGWLSCPPVVYQVGVVGRFRPRGGQGWRLAERGGPGLSWPLLRRHIGLTWYRPLLRSLLLGLLAISSTQALPLWLATIPWLLWLLRILSLAGVGLAPLAVWQRWWRLIGWVERGLLPLACLWALGERWLGEGAAGQWATTVLLAAAPRVTVSHDEQGHCYRASLSGNFTLTVADDDRFRVRLLVLFLRLLAVAAERRGSRKTRDGRTPFVRQQVLAAALGIPQPHLSRWEGYWLAGDWRRLLSQQAKEVLTGELQQQIIETWARVPSYGVAQVYALLRGQGLAVTESQVRQAASESGWQVVRGVLAEQYEQQAKELRLRDGWLVAELLRQITFLLEKVEAGEGLTAEERLEVASWQAGSAAVGLVAPPPLKASPWLLRVERVVFGGWEAVTDGSVSCLYCGGRAVTRKSQTPRLKKYWDADGQLREVAVFRYYCHNPHCTKGSFTDLPPGLVPYSRYRTEAHLLAWQMYAWGRSNYRRTGAALQVTSLTAYRWVSGWGHQLLPVAALFGLVKSSGVVGVDEKYVLVPKNSKPAGKMHRWMYVYFAVDVYTYDLLHIAIFPHNDEESAHAFLLALRAKGYHPRVVVTDLRQDYGPVLAQVFPRAAHHECLFHALQNVQTHVKEVYGPGYAQTYPEAETLKQAIYAIFDTKTKRTAHKRYAAVLALREQYVQAVPQAAVIFAFLERHWPKLVNAVESDLIPTTNNAVEMVIGRFDQHYQNFRGFESIESAQLFLGVFEKLYRFTPFSQDAQPAIRGKSPLQLAGYDISQLPMATLCRAQSIIWPTEATYVPNS